MSRITGGCRSTIFFRKVRELHKTAVSDKSCTTGKFYRTVVLFDRVDISNFLDIISHEDSSARDQLHHEF